MDLTPRGDIARDTVMTGIGDTILDPEIRGELKSKVPRRSRVSLKSCYRTVTSFVSECSIEFWYLNEKILINDTICLTALLYPIPINHFIFHYETAICQKHLL